MILQALKFLDWMRFSASFSWIILPWKFRHFSLYPLSIFISPCCPAALFSASYFVPVQTLTFQVQIVKFHCSCLLTFTVGANILLCQTNLKYCPSNLGKIDIWLSSMQGDVIWVFCLFDCSNISALGIPMSKIRYFVLSFCSCVWIPRHALSTCHLCVDHSRVLLSRAVLHKV